MRAAPVCVFGNAMTSRMLSVPIIIITEPETLKRIFLLTRNANAANIPTNTPTDIKEYKYLRTKTPISGKIIMFTGGFINKSRSELKSLAETMGAKIVSTISKNTDFLVTGSKKPTIKKVNDAKSLKIKILTEDDWNKIIPERTVQAVSKKVFIFSGISK